MIPVEGILAELEPLKINEGAARKRIKSDFSILNAFKQIDEGLSEIETAKRAAKPVARNIESTVAKIRTLPQRVPASPGWQALFGRETLLDLARELEFKIGAWKALQRSGPHVNYGWLQDMCAETAYRLILDCSDAKPVSSGGKDTAGKWSGSAFRTLAKLFYFHVTARDHDLKKQCDRLLKEKRAAA